MNHFVTKNIDSPGNHRRVIIDRWLSSAEMWKKIAFSRKSLTGLCNRLLNVWGKKRIKIALNGDLLGSLIFGMSHLMIRVTDLNNGNCF